MKAVYINTDIQDFKNDMLKEILNFYGELEHKIYESSFSIKIPFGNTDLWASFRYWLTIVSIGDIDVSVANNDEQVFKKENATTENAITIFNLLILKNNSITLLQGDSKTTYGGQSIYSILNTDKGLVFFSCCERPNNISVSKSIHIESGKDLTPATFGNQVLSNNNEVLKQPFRLTDKDGEIYTALDIYNISYKPDNFIALPKSFISSWNLANKDNPEEPIMTSLLIYDEEEEG